MLLLIGSCFLLLVITLVSLMTFPRYGIDRDFNFFIGNVRSLYYRLVRWNVWVFRRSFSVFVQYFRRVLKNTRRKYWTNTKYGTTRKNAQRYYTTKRLIRYLYFYLFLNLSFVYYFFGWQKIRKVLTGVLARVLARSPGSSPGSSPNTKSRLEFWLWC